MRLNAQELSVRKRRACQRTRSNFTLSSTDSASGGRTNVSRDGRIQELRVQPLGLQPPPRPMPFSSLLIVRTEPLYPRSKPLLEILAVRRLDRIAKDFEHCRVWRGQGSYPPVRITKGTSPVRLR